MVDRDASTADWFSVFERCVSIPAADALVLADVHLGRGAASNVDAPLADGRDAIERLRPALERASPATVVIGGDLLHSFSTLPTGVEADLRALESCVERAGARLVVTPGNHDSMLGRVFDGGTSSEVRLADGETVVCHGHERPDPGARRYVIGHDHPALSVAGEKRPCFLYAPAVYDGADVLVLPAFTRLAAGRTVNRLRPDGFQSPLVADLDVCQPGVYEPTSGEVLWFPPLGECRRLL